MTFYSVETNFDHIYIDLDKIETMKDLPVMNEGDDEVMSVVMTTGKTYTVKKASLFSAFMHAGVKVMGTNEETK